MRVTPRPVLGLVAFAAYLVVVGLVQGTSGIPYTELGASASNLWRSGVLSLVLGSAVVAALLTWWGWWGPALVERPRSTRRWTVVAPVLLFVVVLGNLVTTHWSALTGSYLAAAVALGVLVGFGEEIATRGALLVGLRGRLGEVLVWITTCVLFGAMHGLNLLFGAALSATLVQMVTAAMHGSVLYIVRRTTGSLIWAMALHGLLDFSVFAAATSGASNGLGLAAIGVGVVGVVLGFFTTKGVPDPAEHPRTGKYPEPA